MDTYKPKNVASVKKKLDQLRQIFVQYRETRRFLGGYRIEVRYRAASLHKLVSELRQNVFTLDWISNRGKGNVYGENWVPLTFTVDEFLANIARSLNAFPVAFKKHLFARDTTLSTAAMSSAVMDLYSMFGICPNEWAQKKKDQATNSLWYLIG